MAAMIPGPDADGSPRRKRSVPVRTRAWRVFGIAATFVVVVPATTARAAVAFEHAGGGLARLRHEPR